MESGGIFGYLYINPFIYITSFNYGSPFRQTNIQKSAVVQEVERWPHTPMSVGSNPNAVVDCLP